MAAVVGSVRGAGFGLLLSALPLVACDEDAPRPERASHPAAISAACTELAAVWCAAAKRCLPSTFQSAYGDSATCVERQAMSCAGTHFGAGSTATPGDVRECASASDVAALELDEACSKWLRREVLRKLPQVCSPIGTLENGKTCLDGRQCASGSCARAANACGHCAAPLSKQDFCFDDADCPPALACRAGHCVSYREQNAECHATAPCQPDLACIGKVCVQRLPAGAPCDPEGDSPCALWPEQLTCSEQGICEPFVWRGQGQGCGATRRGQCAFGLVCEVRAAGGLGATSVERHCAPVIEDRLDCATVGVRYPQGGPCRAPAVCFENRCQLPDTAACSVLPP